MIYLLILMAAFCMWSMTKNRALLRLLRETEKERNHLARQCGWHGLHDGEN